MPSCFAWNETYSVTAMCLNTYCISWLLSTEDASSFSKNNAELRMLVCNRAPKQRSHNRSAAACLHASAWECSATSIKAAENTSGTWRDWVPRQRWNACPLPDQHDATPALKDAGVTKRTVQTMEIASMQVKWLRHGMHGRMNQCSPVMCHHLTINKDAHMVGFHTKGGKPRSSRIACPNAQSKPAAFASWCTNQISLVPISNGNFRWT